MSVSDVLMTRRPRRSDLDFSGLGIDHPSKNSMGNLPHLLHKIIPPTFVSLTHHHICVRSPPISTFCGIRRGRGSEASQSRAKGKDSRPKYGRGK
ncbi:hypothetical protein C349_03494 [Cryptococcus neoformans var. grubii Br795]|nr:hypothetical protein C349_03494 [Cryptococcus neoformans var. grubii Br795]